MGIAPVVPARASTPAPSEPASEREIKAEAPTASEPKAAGREAEPVVTLPTPEAAFARPAAPVVSEMPPSSTTATETSAPVSATETPNFRPQRGGASIALLAAAGLAIGVLGYRYLHRSAPAPDVATLAVQPVAPPQTPVSPSAESAPATATARELAPSATAADFPAAPPAPLDAPSEAKAEPAPSAAPAAGVTRVTITTVPPKAKFFHYGKEVGTSPFVVDLAPGEKHAYEVWLPGHITRKVLVDGTKTEINLGLREETR